VVGDRLQWTGPIGWRCVDSDLPRNYCVCHRWPARTWVRNRSHSTGSSTLSAAGRAAPHGAPAQL